MNHGMWDCGNLCLFGGILVVDVEKMKNWTQEKFSAANNFAAMEPLDYDLPEQPLGIPNPRFKG
jgi:hypothetical protein